MELIGIIISGFLLYLLFQTINKIEYYSLRKESKKLKAKVIEFRKHKAPSRNDYTQLKYPYVIIVDIENDRLIKLKYSISWPDSIGIGDELDVFWCGADLLYWHAFDTGISKYLPAKWNVFKD